MMHRRIALLSTAFALAVACSAEVDGPVSPAAAAELRGTPAMLQTQARGAALRFVEAYRVTVLGGDDLEALAATPLMRRFAYWLAVTNRAFPGDITATSTVSEIGPAISVSTDGQVLDVELAAQVDVVAQPPDGDPLQLSVPLVGPVRLAAIAPGAWRVIDFVRFGRPVSSAFMPLGLVYQRRGLRITLDSIGVVPTWSFFVRVAATGPKALTLAEDDVTLVDTAGDVVGDAIEVSTPLLEVAPGDRIDGALSFEPLTEIQGVSLRIDISGTHDPAPLEIPLGPILGNSAVARSGA
ncbi:MAG: hypothetical protein WEE66_06530 [Actinomycetota bacterium]